MAKPVLGDVVVFDLYHYGLVIEINRQARKQYTVKYKQFRDPTVFYNRTKIIKLRYKDIMEISDTVKLCAECGAIMDKTPLDDIVKTNEFDEGENDWFEQWWHRGCFCEYHSRQLSDFMEGD